jgi:VanZ family protein
MKWVTNGLKRWWPVLLMMTLIFLASSIPGDRMPHAGQWDFSVKKGGHMTGYALLAVSLMLRQQRTTPRTFLITLGVCLIYALSDEYHQSFVPGRNSTLLDVGIDMIGASVGVMVWWLVRRWRRTEFHRI